MNRLRKTPRVFIYFDDEGIQSLYAQIVTILETERVRKVDRGDSGRLRAKIGFGGVMSALLGNVEAEKGKRTEVSEEIKMRMTMEHQLQQLIRYLTRVKDEKYFDDLFKALSRSREIGEGVYVDIFVPVNAPQFYLYSNPVAEINSVGVMSFEISPPEYDYSDDYFRKPKDYKVIMQASLSKFPRVHGSRLSPLGHEAILFRAYHGRNVPLNIFGYLFSIGHTGAFFQIKPFAIWL